MAADFSFLTLPPAVVADFSFLTLSPAVAADYWLIVAHKKLVGSPALPVHGDDVPGSSVLVYASCTLTGTGATSAADWNLATMRHPAAGVIRNPLRMPKRMAAGNGSVTIMAVNVGNTSVALDLKDAGGAALPPTPRLEWVLTPPGGTDLASTFPVLNGACVA